MGRHGEVNEGIPTDEEITEQLRELVSKIDNEPDWVRRSRRGRRAMERASQEPRPLHRSPPEAAGSPEVAAS